MTLLFDGAIVQLGRRHYEEYFYVIDLNLDQWFRRRCRLQDFLSRALAALLFDGADPFVQFYWRALWVTCL